jgi:uncharacterized protein
MRLSNYLKIYSCRDNPDQLLLFSTKRMSKILVPKSVLNAIEEGNLSSKEEQTLSRLGFLVEESADERREMLEVIGQANRLSNKCRIMAVMNLDCNLACPYCFEGNRKGGHYMSAETADQLVDFVSEKFVSCGKNISVDFYGGEPLLSLEMIKDVSRKLKELAESKGLAYTFTLVTNGTLLTAKVARELAALGLKSVKVTLDGPKETHDASRPFVSGNGSFDVILKNIKDICELLKVQVGGNYNAENYRKFPELLDILLAEGLTPDKLSLVMFAPVTKTFGEYMMPEFSEGCSSIDEPWLAEASAFLREEIMRRGFRTPKVSPSICMIEFDDFLVVNHDGTLYKCPAFIGCEGLDVGDLQTGVRDFRESHNLDVWKKDECLDCTYLPLCFGGCRFLKLLQDGSIDDVECRKAYLDANLETLLQQDLKYSCKADK